MARLGSSVDPLYTRQDDSGNNGTASSATAGAGTFNVTTSSGSKVAANSSRRGLQVVNGTDTDVSLGLGGAATAGQGIVLKAGGGSWDGRISGVLWTGSVFAIHAGSGTKAVGYIEV